jgi:hypothetical protein
VAHVAGEPAGAPGVSKQGVPGAYVDSQESEMNQAPLRREITTGTIKPLRPPLAAPDENPGEAHFEPEAADRGSASGNGKPAAQPRVTERPPQSQPLKSRTSKPNRLTCREFRVKAPWPCAGWYSLDRRIIPGSVPPDILTEAERRSWARLNRQWMGLYCSMVCLRRSMERLEQLDEKFRQHGIGTRMAGLVAQHAIDARRTQELGGAE